MACPAQDRAVRRVDPRDLGRDPRRQRLGGRSEGLRIAPLGDQVRRQDLGDPFRPRLGPEPVGADVAGRLGRRHDGDPLRRARAPADRQRGRVNEPDHRPSRQLDPRRSGHPRPQSARSDHGPIRGHPGPRRRPRSPARRIGPMMAAIPGRIVRLERGLFHPADRRRGRVDRRPSSRQPESARAPGPLARAGPCSNDDSSGRTWTAR